MSADTIEWLRSQADRKRYEAERCEELASGMANRRSVHGPWRPQEGFKEQANSDSYTRKLTAKLIEVGLFEGKHELKLGEVVFVFSGPVGDVWGGALLVKVGERLTMLVDAQQWNHDKGALLDWADHFLTDGW